MKISTRLSYLNGLLLVLTVVGTSAVILLIMHKELESQAMAMQESRLKVEVAASGHDEISRVGQAFNTMLGQFRGIVRDIHANGAQIAASSQQLLGYTSEIASTAQDVSRSSEVQKEATGRLASSTTALSASNGSVAQQLGQCSGKAEDTLAAAEAGLDTGTATVEAMTRIRQSTAAEAVRNASASMELSATASEIEAAVQGLEQVALTLAKAVGQFSV
jgi:methyl-accepting chemotaxis protein